MTTTDPRPPSTPSGARRDFRLYQLSQTTAAFGSVFLGTATSVIAVQFLEATPAQIGLLATTAALPGVLFGPIGGVIADRVRRPRRLLVVGDVAAAVAIAVVAAGLLAGVASIAWLVVLAAALGCVNAVCRTVYFTHLNALQFDGLARSRARLQSGEYLAGAAAGATAAPAISAVGGPAAYLLDAVARIVSAVTLLGISTPDRNPAHDDATAAASGPRAFLASMRDGVRAIVDSPTLRPIAVLALFAQLGHTGAATLYALFVLGELGVPTVLYGIPATCAMVCSVAGSVLAPTLMDRGWSSRRMLVAGYGSLATAALVLPLVPPGPAVAVPVLAVAMGVSAFAGALSNIGLVGVMTDAAGEELFGRVSAGLGTVIAAGSALAGVLAGQLGELLGVRAAIGACALLMGVAIAVGLPAVLRGMRPGAPAGAR